MSTGLAAVDSKFVSDTLGVATLPGGDYVYMEVTDTGCGMSRETIREDIRSFLHHEIYRPGIGPGRSARHHEGSWREESRSTASRDREQPSGFFFPVRNPSSPSWPREEEPEAGLGFRDYVQGAILVVDDEETVLSVTRRMLEREGTAGAHGHQWPRSP